MRERRFSGQERGGDVDLPGDVAGRDVHPVENNVARAPAVAAGHEDRAERRIVGCRSRNWRAGTAGVEVLRSQRRRPNRRAGEGVVGDRTVEVTDDHDRLMSGDVGHNDRLRRRMSG